MSFFSGWSFSNTLWTETTPDNILIGWSLGGLLAIKKCLEKPHYYQKLILINSTPYFSNFSDQYWQMAQHDLISFQKKFLQWVFYPYLSRHIKNWQSHFIAATPATKEKLMQELYFLKTTDLRASYKTLTLPILRIQGSNDALVPVEHFLASNEIHKVLSGGHALLFTERDQVNSIIQEFICH